MSEAVVVATIGAVGVVLAALFQSMRRENKNDHSVVANGLDRIEKKLDGHINDHLKGDI